MSKNNNKSLMVNTKIGGVSLASMAIIPDCSGTNCKIHKMCPYVKHGQCGFRKKNILRTISVYMKAFPEGDEYIGKKIGELLIPAWDHYYWSMIESQALESMIVGDVKTGIIKAHPIFAMQERFIRQIISLENQFHLKHVSVDSDADGDSLIDDETMLIEGDPEYYENMAGGAEQGDDDNQNQFDEEDI